MSHGHESRSRPRPRESRSPQPRGSRSPRRSGQNRGDHGGITASPRPRGSRSSGPRQGHFRPADHGGITAMTRNHGIAKSRRKHGLGGGGRRLGRLSSPSAAKPRNLSAPPSPSRCHSPTLRVEGRPCRPASEESRSPPPPLPPPLSLSEYSASHCFDPPVPRRRAPGWGAGPRAHPMANGGFRRGLTKLGRERHPGHWERHPGHWERHPAPCPGNGIRSPRRSWRFSPQPGGFAFFSGNGIRVRTARALPRQGEGCCPSSTSALATSYSRLPKLRYTSSYTSSSTSALQPTTQATLLSSALHFPSYATLVRYSRSLSSSLPLPASLFPPPSLFLPPFHSLSLSLFGG